MAIARNKSGAIATLRALASQVHPVFMLPAIAASVFGAILAREMTFVLVGLHGGIVFCELYTAHVKDGYVDFYLRNEDEDHPLTARGCRLALASASGLVFAGLAILWIVVSPLAAFLTLPGWLIAYFHAPQLDTNPITATIGYPLGIAFTLVSGYYVHAGTLTPMALVFGLVFLVLLSGIKIIDDATDYHYDRSIEKRTVAVVFGRERARTGAFALMIGGLCIVGGAVAASIFPPSSIVAAVTFAVIAATTRRMTAKYATMILVRGSYVFLALLVVAVWFHPLR